MKERKIQTKGRYGRKGVMDGRMLWKEGIYGKKGEMEASKL